MGHTRFLSHGQAERFYDRFGAKLDTRSFYELPALRDLAKHLDLKTCRAVVEFGCGTGRFAAELLETSLSSQATYLGVDVSRVMVALTNRRLARYGRRAEVRKSDGTPHIGSPDGAFDRLICSYVLDLLPDDEIRSVLREAHRVLVPGGLLGLASLTNGRPGSYRRCGANCTEYRLGLREAAGQSRSSPSSHHPSGKSTIGRLSRPSVSHPR